MGMGFAPTWLRQVSPPPASRDHFNHCMILWCVKRWILLHTASGNSRWRLTVQLQLLRDYLRAGLPAEFFWTEDSWILFQ